MKETKKTYRTSKLRMFLFFLLMALIFWALSKFSNESIANIEVKIKYVNLPKNVSVSETALDKVSVDVSATGFQFLTYKIKSSIIKVDISQYHRKKDTVIILSNSELNSLISSQFKNDLSIRTILLEKLEIPLDVVISKWLPIKLQSNISFKDGYKLIEEVKISPDSIAVSGPSKLLSKIDSIYTQVVSMNTISEDVSEEISLIAPDNPEINIGFKTTALNVKVSEFTQKQMLVPITVINVPKDTSLKLLPENILVDFEVSIKKFNEVVASDFKIICDFKENDFQDNFMTPQLTERPDGLYHIALSTDRVEYLIFK